MSIGASTNNAGKRLNFKDSGLEICENAWNLGARLTVSVSDAHLAVFCHWEPTLSDSAQSQIKEA
jgi:hypothetical protein